MKNGADPGCHICTQYEGTIDHLISGCPTLVPSEYLIDTIEWPNTSTGKSINIMEPNILKNGMNISQKLSQKLTVLPFYRITAYKQTEKSKQQARHNY